MYSQLRPVEAKAYFLQSSLSNLSSSFESVSNQPVSSIIMFEEFAPSGAEPNFRRKGVIIVIYRKYILKKSIELSYSKLQNKSKN